MFKTVEECIGLAQEHVVPDTTFEYVFNCEETDFDDFDLDGNLFDQLNEIRNAGNGDIQVVEAGRMPYDEFTRVICPAYKAE